MKHSSLVAEPVAKGAAAVLIRMEGETPVKDQAYLNKLMDVFVNSGLEEKYRIADNTIEFIEEQLLTIRDSLFLVEERLQDFRSENRVMDLSAEGSALFERLTELESKKSMETVNLQYYNYLLSYVNERKDFTSVVAPSAMGIQDQLLNTMISNLAEIYSQMNIMKLNSTERNPRYSQLKAQADAALESLQENVHSLIKASQILVEEYSREIKSIEGEISSLPATERGLVNIQRDYSLNENLYVFYFKDVPK